jgi:hypothetical protein
MSRKAVISERKALPPAFTYTQARAAGISAERLYAYRAKGLDQIARGLYRWADAPEVDQDLLEIAHRAPRLCLITALARHGLTDMILPRIDIALPRGSRVPTLRDRSFVASRIFTRSLKNCRVYSRPCGARQTRRPRQLVIEQSGICGVRGPLTEQGILARSQVIEEPGYVNLIEGAAHRVQSCMWSANAFTNPVSGIAGTVSVP